MIFCRGKLQEKKNHIARLCTDQGTVHDHKDKAEALFEHFQGIMAAGDTSSCTLDFMEFGMPSANFPHLEVPFTEEEMWHAIKALPTEKSPGPDGLTAEFYKSAWQVIKADLLLALNAFNRRDRRGMSGINNALITLLPKKADAQAPGDYRPICLIHSFSKL